MGTALRYSAPQHVRDVIESMGRTEDVRFSPSNTRLAVSCFLRNRIAVFDVALTTTGATLEIELANCVELSSSGLDHPHGLDFIDEDTVIVANRGGDVTILPVPAAELGQASRNVLPLQTWSSGGTSLLRTPGSVAVIQHGHDPHEILICNNSEHTVTRHELDVGAGYASERSAVLLRKWLDIPDGISVSQDRQWIAISNHNAHSAFLYERTPSLTEQSDPAAMLRGVQYPHGIRFAPDGEHLLVADAGAPYVHLYARNGGRWSGVQHPAASIRVMPEAAFLRGHYNPQEGGPKGLDIDRTGRVVAVTSEFQTLAFFDMAAMVRSAFEAPVGEPQAMALEYELRVVGEHTELREEQARLRGRAASAEQTIRVMQKSRSWRITAPLRNLVDRIKK